MRGTLSIATAASQPATAARPWLSLAVGCSRDDYRWQSMAYN